MSTTFDILCPVSEEIWDLKYRLKDENGAPVDITLDDTFRRVARAVAGAEEKKRARRKWEARFHEALADFAFLPGGRILAGAGAERAVTLFNCFVMGQIADDLASIFDGVKEAALTMQQGGGIGQDFSTLRPRGAPVARVGAEASGPVSFMDVWDAMCRTIMSAGMRRGAMMGTMRCDHPDIEDFISAKADPARLRNFNLSVLVTDDFMSAVRSDAHWPLVFEGTIYRTLPARALWEKILRATYDYAEPGVIFIDRVNALNPLSYCETIHATNPCGEQPLPPYGACMLGSINLARLVKDPFSPRARLDEERLAELSALAVRFLDNVIEVSHYPLPQQEAEAKAKRRIGLGITGLADALILCGERYGSGEAAALAERWMGVIEHAAYLASSELAREKGVFPKFDADAYLAAPHVTAQAEDVRRAIARRGLRNGLLTSIAPTGTISLLAGNVSSGVEPVFDFSYMRRILLGDGTQREEEVQDYAYRLYRHMFGPDAPLPDSFVTTRMLAPAEHIAMQAALQRHVDSAISKTVNCPEDISFEAFKSVYDLAYDSGLKGCTTYRPNPVTGSVLRPHGEEGSGDTERSAERARAPEAPGEVQTSLPLVASRPPEGVVERMESGARERDGIVYMAEPLERDSALPGFTYKLTWPGSDHAIYVTINDIVQDGRRRPFEIFINSKNLEHYAWTVALTRMISAVFRRGGDVSFVVEELKAVFDPRGGEWMNGHYVPSLLAAIGEVIERHMIDIGFMAAPERLVPEETGSGTARGEDLQLERAPARELRYCPKCAQPALVFQEGCHSCRSCGWSKCS